MYKPDTITCSSLSVANTPTPEQLLGFPEQTGHWRQWQQELRVGEQWPFLMQSQAGSENKREIGVKQQMEESWLGVVQVQQ